MKILQNCRFIMADKKNSIIDKPEDNKISPSTEKEVIEIAQKIRPDKNSVVLQDGSDLGWNIKPGKKSTKFGLEFKKDFVDDDVEIMVRIGGEANYFTSPKGAKDFIQTAEICATQKF